MRKYIADDVLVRVLRHNNFEVQRFVNITDVGHLTQDEFDTGEDKIVAAARREGKSPLAIAEFYSQAFFTDLDQLNILPPESYIKASDHIPEMQHLTARLIKKGHAYVSNGSVYFDVSSFEPYGRLSGNTVAQLQERVRAELKKEVFEQKRNPADFALWIKAEASHILQWPSPWGAGYPGWHIECAAMILKHLGDTIDVHTGGEDHIFPHHEDEIAEAQAATGKPLARTWLHVRHLFVDGKKMSKRAGTFIRVEDIKAKGFHPLAFRFLVLGTHYRSHLNFTWRSMRSAQEGWLRYVETIRKLREMQATAQKNDSPPAELLSRLKRIDVDFDKALNDDLATPRALAASSELIGVSNTHLAGHAGLSTINALLERFLHMDELLGLLPHFDEQLSDNEQKTLYDLLAERTRLRAAKEYAKADAVRESLQKMGYELQEHDLHIRWTKIATGQSGTFTP